MMTVHQYLKQGIAKWGEDPYIYTKGDDGFTGRTFAEFAEDVFALAAFLGEHKNPGGCVYIYGSNSAEWMICDLAAMGYTGISVPLDKEWTLHDLENVIADDEDGLFFYSADKDETVGKLKTVRRKLEYFCFESDFEMLLEKGKKLPEPTEKSNPDETAKIIFTSGTTAQPKAIPLSQRNMFANWETLYKRTPMDHNDISYMFLPLNHVYSGVANFLYSIISGMRIYLCRNIKEINEDIIAVRPTVICTVPVLLEGMHRLMTDELLSALKEVRFLYNGGSFTRPELKKWFIENGINLLEAYGTTETSSVIALARITGGKPEYDASVMENLTVKIADTDENGVGEILVSGESVSSGYLDCSDNSRYFDVDGFYHTGDLGRLDEEMHLYVSGRKKRMLDTPDGKNVFADEIEALILENTEITKAKVYMENGAVTASVYARLKNHSENEIAAILEAVNEKLPKFKKIRSFHIIDDIPGGRIK